MWLLASIPGDWNQSDP